MCMNRWSVISASIDTMGSIASSVVLTLTRSKPLFRRCSVILSLIIAYRGCATNSAQLALNGRPVPLGRAVQVVRLLEPGHDAGAPQPLQRYVYGFCRADRSLVPEL